MGDERINVYGPEEITEDGQRVFMFTADAVGTDGTLFSQPGRANIHDSEQANEEIRRDLCRRLESAMRERGVWE